VLLRIDVMKFHPFRIFQSFLDWLQLERLGLLYECWRLAFLYQNVTHAVCLLFESLCRLQYYDNCPSRDAEVRT
jgi:hypothetical protein